MDFTIAKAKKKIFELTNTILGVEATFEDTGNNDLLLHMPLLNPVNDEKTINIEVSLFDVGNLYISFMCDKFEESEELYQKINDFNITTSGVFKAYLDQEDYKGKLFVELNVVDVFDLDRLAKYYEIALSTLFNKSKIAEAFNDILRLNEA